MLRAVSVISILFMCNIAQAETTSEFLNRFHKNPKAVMNEVPVKYLDGVPLPRGAHSRFDQNLINSRQYVNIKVNTTKACRRDDATEAAIDNANAPQRFFSTPFIYNLKEMADKKLEVGQADIKPWSGDYWAIANGILGARYYDREFDKLYGWKEKETYIANNPFMEIFQTGDQDQLNSLAIAEKYELLVGDTKGTFSQRNWDQGRGYYEANGDVESWMGICHGWAPASYMVPEPQHSIDVKSFDDSQTLHLYPAEIKGLISYQWANNSYRNRFISRRCYEKDPAQDEFGRITDPGCFDANPGTWHIVTVNQIGVRKKNFVIDATFDYEVWNQPVYSYSYRYFNPESRKSFDTLAEAKIPLSDYKADYFFNYRSNKTKNIVGVSMRITYVLENSVHQEEKAKEATLITAIYRYDLELDEDDNIIGGEWYTNVHPDFLWTPYDGEDAHGHLDKYLDDGLWTDPSQPLPLEWRKAAIVSNPENEVLGTIVDHLVEQARIPLTH